jgi:hypothetical protein
LTPVLATLSLWEGRDELPEQLRGDVQMMRRNIELETRLIDELIDVNRIMRGTVSLKPERTDAHELISSVLKMYSSEIYSHGLSVITDLAAQQHYVNVDRDRVQQAFWNILKNAAAHTPSGGRMGSEFRVTLPTVGPPADQVLAVPIVVTKTAMARCRMRILLVEDHNDSATVMARVLSHLGHQVDIAGTVTAAVDLFQNEQYDLVLSDLGLPDGSGIDLVRKLREIRESAGHCAYGLRNGTRHHSDPEFWFFSPPDEAH